MLSYVTAEGYNFVATSQHKRHRPTAQLPLNNASWHFCQQKWHSWAIRWYANARNCSAENFSMSKLLYYIWAAANFKEAHRRAIEPSTNYFTKVYSSYTRFCLPLFAEERGFCVMCGKEKDGYKLLKSWHCFRIDITAKDWPAIEGLVIGSAGCSFSLSTPVVCSVLQQV